VETQGLILAHQNGWNLKFNVYNIIQSNHIKGNICNLSTTIGTERQEVSFICVNRFYSIINVP
jgi:hypothetical protein